MLRQVWLQERVGSSSPHSGSRLSGSFCGYQACDFYVHLLNGLAKQEWGRALPCSRASRSFLVLFRACSERGGPVTFLPRPCVRRFVPPVPHVFVARTRSEISFGLSSKASQEARPRARVLRRAHACLKWTNGRSLAASFPRGSRPRAAEAPVQIEPRNREERMAILCGRGRDRRDRWTATRGGDRMDSIRPSSSAPGRNGVSDPRPFLFADGIGTLSFSFLFLYSIGFEVACIVEVSPATPPPRC